MGRLVCTFMDMAEEVRTVVANTMGDTLYTRQYPDEYEWAGDTLPLCTNGYGDGPCEGCDCGS